MERNHYLTIAFSILSFFLSVFFLGKIFEIGSRFALKIVIAYVLIFFFISAILNWIFYFFVGRGELARYFENIIHQFYVNMRDRHKRNIGGNHRNIIKTSVEDQGLSTEFRGMMTEIWAKMENTTIQQSLMNEISWRRALRRYAKLHPERFSKDVEEDGEFTLIKGENPG